MSEFGPYPENDEETTRGLRALYAAPAGYGYWNELESRIMARVASVEMAWWDEFDRWIRPALAIAAILVFAAGLTMFRSHQEEADASYGDILQPISVPPQTIARPTLQLEPRCRATILTGPKA